LEGNEVSEYTFAAGDVVELKPERLRNYPAKYAGRRALVDGCFRRMGGKEETVRLQWLHKTTGKKIGHQEFFSANVLQKPPACSPCNPEEMKSE
jgi:hypothetical protein